MKREEVDRAKLSPGMKQYMEIKDNYKDELLFYRLGDFYELFFEDGIIASRECELTLTGKNAGLEEKIPMCGVPFHSVKPYIEKLVEKGYKIAICEQLEDPSTTKGIVKRGVVQVISKGTIVDNDLLNEHDNNYIASILDFKYIYILTYADISTGELSVLEVAYDIEKLVNEVVNLNIKEVVLADNSNTKLINILKNNYSVDIDISSEYLENEYQEVVDTVDDIRYKTGIKHLFYFLKVKQLKELTHFHDVNIVNRNDYLQMDIHTVRNLELVETLRLKERTYSLLWLLDKTKTAMGSRMLKHYILNPLRDKKEIEKRYNKIEKLNEQFILKDNLIKLLDEIYDIERLCGKVSCGSLNARDLLQLKNSIKVLPEIKKIIKELKFDEKIDTLDDLYKLLEESIYENPPITLKEGYLIKEGYNKELDELKDIRSGGKSFIADFESKIKEETGIKTLKVGFNKVFGYYIEVSKGQVSEIPDNLNWERRQTLTTGERFISPELKEKESLILNAEEKIINLEYDLFCEIKEEVKKYLVTLKNLSIIIANLDAITSLAVCAEVYNLVKPTLNEDNIIEVIEGRHPVVERVSKDSYVSNDCIMNNKTNTLLITGPNMSGKSTYMRQLAIIVIMAQIGSYVPAKIANLMVIDKIYTRIGASDDLVAGESTFMVEMKEAKNAIIGATKNSLILFDELGRGTATYDGMSLARAILEYVNNNIKCKTLFSTHYHELTSLERDFSGIKNVHVSATEEDGDIIFLHKVKSGAVDKSYGIHVAKLSGMPKEVIDNASKILSYYESNKKLANNDKVQLSMDFDEVPKEENKVEKKLKEIDVLSTSPIEAMNLLYELKEMLNEKE